MSSIYLGALVGLATGAVQWVRARTARSAALLLPPAWVGLEKLLQYGDLRFTWGVIADTLTPYPILIQTAELWGPLGISFLVVAVNGLAYTLWRTWDRPYARRRTAAALAGLGVLVLSYGAIRWRALAPDRPAAASTGSDPAAPDGNAMGLRNDGTVAREEAGTVRIAVIQPNIPQEARDDPKRAEFEKRQLFELSRRALSHEPDLVVWPETATPWLRYDPAYLGELIALCCRGDDATDELGSARRGRGSDGARGTPFLVGGLDALDAGGPEQRIFNAAFMIEADGRLAGIYRKMLLVPMTEQIPYSRLLSFLKPERWSGSFSVGDGFEPLAFTISDGSRGERVEVGVPICYEITFPQAIRAFRRHGARLIVTITNDAWFGRTAAPFQHFSQLRLRAVENRVAIARAANTGISGFVSARGDVLDETAIFEPAYLVRDLPLAAELTPYARWGDWLVPATWIGWAAFLISSTSARRRTSRELARQQVLPGRARPASRDVPVAQREIS